MLPILHPAWAMKPVTLDKENTLPLITNEKLEELLAASPAERVTKEYREARIGATEFHRPGETVTVCQITLETGYPVRGENACVNPENHNQQIGEKIVHDNAFRERWPLFSFLPAEKNKLLMAAA